MSCCLAADDLTAVVALFRVLITGEGLAEALASMPQPGTLRRDIIDAVARSADSHMDILPLELVEIGRRYDTPEAWAAVEAEARRWCYGEAFEAAAYEESIR